MGNQQESELLTLMKNRFFCSIVHLYGKVRESSPVSNLS